MRPPFSVGIVLGERPKKVAIIAHAGGFRRCCVMRRHWVRSFLPLVLALALVRFSEFPILNADEVTGKSLQVDVLQPVYRQNIYATESMPEIVLRVRLSPPLRQQASSIRGRILDVNQQEMQRQDLAVADLDTVRFAAASLAVGQYTVQMQALDADQQVVAQAQTAIRKLPPAAGSEVRIDQHRNILVNGKPVVLIGWYGTVPLDDPRPDVVALQNVQTPVVVDYPNKEPVAKAFRERGIYSIVSLEPGRLFYSFQLWRKPGNSVAQEWSKLSAPSEECRGYLRQMVELLRDEPGLLGWYLADEPEINNVRADYLESLYRAVRELDPYHPVIDHERYAGRNREVRLSSLRHPEPGSRTRRNRATCPVFCKRPPACCSRDKPRC